MNLPLGLRTQVGRLYHILMYFLPFKIKKSYVIIFCLSLPALYYIIFRNALANVFSLPFCFFVWPLEVNMPELVEKVLKGYKPDFEPLNKDSYPITMDNDKLCKTEEGGDDDTIFLLYVIKTRMESFEARSVIRRTYIQEDLVPGILIKHVFLVGMRPGDSKLQQQIAQEHLDYQDMVQGYFNDSYFNNTLKLMMGFKWATTRCPSADFVVFGDDDFFFSTSNIVRFLDRKGVKAEEDYITGYSWHYASPHRYTSSVWYMPMDFYPYRFYPPYPSAGGFIVSRSAVQKLNVAMRYTKFFPFDDVFLGIAAWKMNIYVNNNDNIYFHKSELEKAHRHHKDLLASHNFKDPKEMEKMWLEHLAYQNREAPGR